MAEVRVGRISEFADGDRRIIERDGVEVGVFCWGSEFFAYSNRCLHQGGPACEGLIMHQVEDVIDADRKYRHQRFSDRANFVCPWHGYEYDIRTGEFAGNRRRRLKSYKIVRRGEELYVDI